MKKWQTNVRIKNLLNDWNKVACTQKPFFFFSLGKGVERKGMSMDFQKNHERSGLGLEVYNRIFPVLGPKDK
jgi:hypothetical protein